jgi:AraC-like DNA-binding protein
MSDMRDSDIDRYSAPSGLASAIGECAARYGIDIGPICKALNIDPASFSDLTGRISMDRLCRLLETCAVITSEEGFGLKTIDFFTPGSTGPYGYGLMSAPNALDFFRFIGDHQQYISDKSYARFNVDNHGAEVAFSYSPLIVKRDQYVDMAIGLIMQRLRGILGADIDAVEVEMERAKPRNVALYKEKISKRISFGRRVNSLRLPPELYFVANSRGDDRLFRLMNLQCSSLRPDRSEGKDFAEDLKEFILTRVAESTISLTEAAEYFHVSERTLQRRLAETGTSLNDLRDDVRRSLAERLLSETELSAGEIALRLGYSAPSAFTRSTIRWFGKTPRDYRRAAL